MFFISELFIISIYFMIMGKYIYGFLNKHSSMELTDLIYIIIALLVAVVLFYIFIWLVPIIIVLIIAYVIYIFLKGPQDY
jgi:hypothetical protein